MDAIADDLDVQVGQDDLTERLVLHVAAVRHRAAAAAAATCRRTTSCRRCSPTCAAGWRVAAVVHGATVTDTDGNVVDTDEFFGPPAGG